MRKLTVKVLIKKVDTGEERWCEEGEDYEGIEFMYSDGNYSCDCNRGNFFRRSHGEPDLVDQFCSDGKYIVLQILRSDGHQYNVCNH